MSTTTPGQMPHLAIDGRVATITLRRPAVANRLELEDLQTLQAQVDEVNASSAVLVLRLVAEGRHFCSGFNIGRVGQRRERCRPALRSARGCARAGAAGDDRGNPGWRLRRCDRPRPGLRLSYRHAGLGAQGARGEAGAALLPRRARALRLSPRAGDCQARDAHGGKARRRRDCWRAATWTAGTVGGRSADGGRGTERDPGRHGAPGAVGHEEAPQPHRRRHRGRAGVRPGHRRRCSLRRSARGRTRLAGKARARCSTGADLPAARLDPCGHTPRPCATCDS